MKLRPGWWILLLLLLAISSASPGATGQTTNRSTITFLLGENEYDTELSLRSFAKDELEPRGLKCLFSEAPPEGGNAFSNPGAIAQADLLVISVRRRTPPRPVLDLVRQHVQSGKPVAGIRTASHAFDATPPDSNHAAWPAFDREVLGAHYQGHFNNKPPLGTWVRVIEKTEHPVLTGVPREAFRASTTLYRSRHLAATVTPLMNGHIEGQPEVSEPVAWVNTAENRRVFYTSLGGPDDFQIPAFRRLLLNAIFWSLQQPLPAAALAAAPKPAAQNAASAAVAAPTPEGPLPPAEAMKRFQIAGDLEIEQVLSEPLIAQPVFLNFDERGRMWVVEYRQYPSPAGLKATSRDQYWRAVYDKVPPPPPRHFRGKDRISIHEDTNGDGTFDKHSIFVDGLNIATSCVRGRGGVWVLNPPYLLFYPDANDDDVPDGDPEVHLSGFGLEDTHSVVNSLRWGPDGWLYAAQGSTVTAKVARPGTNDTPVHSMGQLIWRYHPEARRYEIFAEGGGNAFGVEIDPKGRIFSGHNGGDTRGFHYVQGGYLQKGFSKHGSLSNPYAFGYFAQMAHPKVQRFTHTFIIYDGGALPEQYRGKLFGVEPLHGRVVLSDIQPDRSSFKTVDLSYPVVSSDKWFRPVDIKLGPDGAIYLADWYDQQVNHYRNHEGQIDPGTGRIYRLKAKGARAMAPFDLRKLSGPELIALLEHPNQWRRQTALRLLGDRKDRSLVAPLRQQIRAASGQAALEKLWALHLCGGFDDAFALEMLDHQDPYVRAWTARLLGDHKKVSSLVADKLAKQAAIEPHVEARSQLACSARRLPAKDGLPIVRALLARAEDTADIHIPLLLWWAIESKAESDREAVLDLFSDPALWSSPLAQQHILSRLMRRYAMAGTQKDLLTCARLLRLSPGREQTAKLLAGFEEAFKGRSLAALPAELLAALAESGLGSTALGVRLGRAEAIERALRSVLDESADRNERLQNIEVLGETKQPRCVRPLLELLSKSTDTTLRKAALTALQAYPDPEIGRTIARLYEKFPEAVRPAALGLLATRATWTLPFLQAIERGQISKAGVPLEALRKMEWHGDSKIHELITKIWSESERAAEQDREQQIKRLAAAIQNGVGDPYRGKKLYAASCASCHKLFDHGGQVGPDLTAYKRDDVETLLLNIVRPNAEIREGFENFVVLTKDDRTLSGFLADQDSRVAVIRGLDGQDIVVPRDQIQEIKPAGMSLMPEGLLDGFDENQVRDLFAYLRSTQPLND